MIFDSYSSLLNTGASETDTTYHLEGGRVPPVVAIPSLANLCLQEKSDIYAFFPYELYLPQDLLLNELQFKKVKMMVYITL